MRATPKLWPGVRTKPASAPSPIPILALFRCHARRGSHGLDLGGAILEFGNFPERVERRVGEQVRRRLHERERDEYDAVGNGVVLTRDELDGAAPGRYPHHVAGLDPQLDDGAAREADD